MSRSATTSYWELRDMTGVMSQNVTHFVLKEVQDSLDLKLPIIEHVHTS